LLVSGTAAVGSTGYSCYGISCEGINPADTICINDARTIMSRHASNEVGQEVGLLELRYSPECKSNWVRFTPWYGIRSVLGNLAVEPGNPQEANGSPWIWRHGVDGTLQGRVGHSSLSGAAVTSWTAMVTADGVTCSSVSLYQGAGDSIGTYNAPCIS
jgi:hypothetical protein